MTKSGITLLDRDAVQLIVFIGGLAASVMLAFGIMAMAFEIESDKASPPEKPI